MSVLTIISSDPSTRWRLDGKCGHQYPLRDKMPSECDPSGADPCCNSQKKSCGSSKDYCTCDADCIDYRKETKINECKIENVRGFLKTVCFNNVLKDHFKCARSDVNYTGELSTWDQHRGVFVLSSVTAVCENDPHVYQACGFNTPMTNMNSKVLCGGYFCQNNSQSLHIFTKSIGSGSNQCTNSTIVDSVDAEDLSPLIKCNNHCDTPNTCEDESICNNYTYGLFCNRLESSTDLGYVPVHWICNGNKGCTDDKDEKDCSNLEESNLTKCVHYYSNKVLGKNITVPIFNHTRCAMFDKAKGIYPYCLDYMDQTNCDDMDRVGGTCDVNGISTNISINMVCHNSSSHFCDDGIENQCIYYKDCSIHKHRMCDMVWDCEDGSDEIDDTCNSRTKDNFKCQRKFGIKEELRLPLTWIKDNIEDCIDRKDELEKYWRSCGDKAQNTSRWINISDGDKEDGQCLDVFLCNNGSTPYVKLDLLCDGIESCGKKLENELCKISRDFPTIKKIAPLDNNNIDLCTINNLRSTQCEEEKFIAPAGTIFGVTIDLIVPKAKVDCNNLFGEFYVYLGCMNRCINTTCPLSDVHLKHDACPGQYSDRVYTLANNNSLTFVTKSATEQYQSNIFQCKNTRCIEYSKVCDLTNDCGDMSDEKYCTNHQKCDNDKQLISLKQQCDGLFDCFDLSDECNEKCGKQILEHWTLKIICWVMGVFATLFNTILLVQTVTSMRSIETGSLLQTKILVALISFGDLLNGVYLIILSVYDSLIFGTEYCKKQMEWLSGETCATLGVISTIGSQLSLFAMTSLSLTRVVGLTCGSMTAPSTMNRKTMIRIVSIAISVVALSATVALIPLIPPLEDYFVQGLYYQPENKLFIGFPNKERHIKVLRSYEESPNLPTNTSWQNIHHGIKRMFTNQYNTLSWNTIHFYGNDGVCLFKFFVRSDDARRSRQPVAKMNVLEFINFQENMFLWIMLAVNFICFVIITVSYVLITIQTWKSSSESGQNPQSVKQNKKIQLRIFLMIATDFLCWVPFIIICALHNLQLIDATRWYSYFAMIVLPINSVINPLLYDNTITNLIKSAFMSSRTFLSSTAVTPVNSTMVHQKEPCQDDQIESKSTHL